MTNEKRLAMMDDKALLIMDAIHARYRQSLLEATRAMRDAEFKIQDAQTELREAREKYKRVRDDMELEIERALEGMEK